jgi:hypothetical protein
MQQRVCAVYKEGLTNYTFAVKTFKMFFIKSLITYKCEPYFKFNKYKANFAYEDCPKGPKYVRLYI